MQVKNRGQVITPKNIIKDILELSDYKGEKILKKHVMENSCANGAFLIEIDKEQKKKYIKELNNI